MRKGIIYVYFNKAKYEKEGVEKYYVGQTIGTMEQRARKDGKGYGAFDETCNSKFARGIKKWGWNAFEGKILEDVDEEDLNELEKFYIKYFDSYKNGYNTTLGGEGTRGYNLNEKSKKKISIAVKKRLEDPKEREKVSTVSKKRWENKELREKISKIQKKYWEDQEYREKRNIAQRKRWENTEEREKITGELSHRARKVYCKELNIIFSYIKLAREYCRNILNCKADNLNVVCKGKLNYSGNYNGTKLTWKYIENVDKEILNNAEYIDRKKYEEIISAKNK